MWIALFSNSGSELAEVIENVGTEPFMILNDRMRTPHDKRLLGKVRVMDHSNIVDYLSKLPKDVVVTLHGYLRILPEKAITDNTFNIHPGDIVKYPQLKGIHPQRKAIQEGLPSTGVVIHKVDSGVDTGEIQMLRTFNIPEGSNEESLINALRVIGVDMWTILLRNKL